MACFLVPTAEAIVTTVIAKAAKDAAAGAVLVYAVFSVIVGFIIFLPKFWNMLV